MNIILRHTKQLSRANSAQNQRQHAKFNINARICALYNIGSNNQILALKPCVKGKLKRHRT